MSRQPADPDTFSDEVTQLFRDDYVSLLSVVVRRFRLREDLAHDAVLHAFFMTRRNWERLDSPRAYWYRVASYEALRLKKTGQLLSDPHVEDLLEQQNAGGDAVSEVVVNKLTREHYLRQLPPRQRQVAVLRAADFPDEEIAQSLGMAVGTVRATAHAARKALRAMRAQEEK